MNDKNAAIGVFDSGVGGLTVAREIIRQLPEESITYFGDTARVPYGSKSKDTIIRYSRQIIRFLKTKNVKAIVVACNTASAFALDTIEKEIDIPIIGVVKPGAKSAVESTKNKRIGIIGTEGTIKSELYTQYIHSIDPEITVVGKACPLFVPLVEEGMLHDSVTDEVASRYLESMKEENIDSLILGCTHYPLLRSTVGKIMGPEVNLVNPAYETAISLDGLLRQNGIRADKDAKPEYEFYVSDAEEKFKEFANSIMPLHIEKINQNGEEMNNNVLIKISGLQMVDDTGDNVESMSAGKYYLKKDKHYVLYEDMDDENDEITKNTIKFNSETVEVTRKGLVTGKLVFKKGKNNQSLYSTPFGDLLMEVYTKDILLEEKEDNIDLKIDYELYANNSKVSDSIININIRETV